MPRRPNIVIFNPDQYRGDVLGHLGNPAAVTPNLDRVVAEEGVSFRSAFCQNPVCTPSRCSFMSGWYPHVRGHRTMLHMMRGDEPVLLQTLKDNGYFVWWNGRNDLVPGQHGYEAFCHVKYEAPAGVRPMWGLDGADSWRGEPGGDNYYSFYAGRLEADADRGCYFDWDWACVTGAVDFLRQLGAAHQPFCLFLGLIYPHPPYAVEEPWFSRIDRGRMPPRIPAPESWQGKPSVLERLSRSQNLQGWSEDRWTELRATYYGMCARVDHQFGLVMEALRDSGVYDDTAVFFFADHGDFTGDCGLVQKADNVFPDCLARVPLVVKPPKDVPVAPRVSDALVELIDFPATVEAMVGIEPQHTHFGRSLLPVLAGQTDDHRDAVFCEGGRLHGETHCMGRELLRSDPPESDLYWPNFAAHFSEGPEHTKAVMIRTKQHKYIRRLYETDELYDLTHDPQELDNRIDDPAFGHVLTQLKERLLTFYLETCDVVPHDTDRR